MSHFSYIESRKDLLPLIDSICGWVELNWCIGGIAFHKVRDLEDRLNKLVPIRGVRNKTYSESDNVSFDHLKEKHVARLYRAFVLLSKLVDLDDAEKLGHRSSYRPSAQDWAIVFEEARSLLEAERIPHQSTP